jgi:hypothetical protein
MSQIEDDADSQRLHVGSDISEHVTIAELGNWCHRIAEAFTEGSRLTTRPPRDSKFYDRFVNGLGVSHIDIEDHEWITGMGGKDFEPLGQPRANWFKPQPVLVICRPSCPGKTATPGPPTHILVDFINGSRTYFKVGEQLAESEDLPDRLAALRDAVFKLTSSELTADEFEPRYFVSPPTLKPRHQPPFWAKDWRGRSRKK